MSNLQAHRRWHSWYWALVVLLATALPLSGARAHQAPESLWIDAAGSPARPSPQGRLARSRHRAVVLDRGRLTGLLSRAPREFTNAARDRQLVLNLPWPDGTMRWFRIEESPVMEAGLAAEFPGLKTYRGYGLDDLTATVRLDWTPEGFHAMVLSSDGTVYIDPVSAADGQYASYFRRDYARSEADRFVCAVSDGLAVPASDRRDTEQYQPANGATLRTYRLALATTGEYTAFFGGTVAGAMNAVVTTMNRVNGIFERDLAVRMTLVSNNSLLIYTNAGTDPYTNSSGTTMLTQNQSNLNSVIGSANYDVGHVFSTGGGGVATLNGPCGSSKARGVTGLPSPVGDAFDVDYVAHEMGHQFGATHTFNGTTSSCGGGNRSPGTAYEPGSGSTIMSYSGICGAENLQTSSDAFFHSGSQSQIISFITNASTGGLCPATTSTGNAPPTVSAGADYTIPSGTPFVLTASGNDVNGDPLTYSWEQFDLGTASPPNTDDGTRPIFRAFLPTSSASRTFPRIGDILANAPTFGESLPTSTRAMNFRVTVRDNRGGGGGTASDDMVVNVRADSGPFAVTQPNTAVTWDGNSAQVVNWSVANTASAPVSATSVRILLSTDGGASFPTVLLASTPNDGAEAVIVPNITTSTARVKIEAVGNIFFDIGDMNFNIAAQSQSAPVITSHPTDQAVLAGQSPQFSVTATGSGFLLYNWQMSTNGGVTWSPVYDIQVGSSPTVLFWSVSPSLNGTLVRCIVSNSIGSATSNTARLTVLTQPPAPSDFDGDGKGDLAIFRPTTGEWFVRQSRSGYSYANLLSLQWGVQGDVPLPADFDGDGTSDLVVYRPSNGTWYVRYSSAGFGYANWQSYQWGLPGDAPLVADFDGDAKADLVVYRPATGEWLIRYSSTGYSYGALGIYQWGLPDDTPLAGDFDGDGRSDLGVYRPATGEWFVRVSSAQFSYGAIRSYQWGLAGDTPIKGDFDGDGRLDLVIYRPSNGTWYVRFSSSNFSYSTLASYQWGLPGDIPLSNDFDGDGRGDLAIWRPTTGEWCIRYSSSSYSYSTLAVLQWGLPGDVPLARK